MQSRIFPKIVAIEDCHLELVADLLSGGGGGGGVLVWEEKRWRPPSPPLLQTPTAAPSVLVKPIMAVDRTGPENLTKK